MNSTPEQRLIHAVHDCDVEGVSAAFRDGAASTYLDSLALRLCVKGHARNGYDETRLPLLRCLLPEDFVLEPDDRELLVVSMPTITLQSEAPPEPISAFPLMLMRHMADEDLHREVPDKIKSSALARGAGPDNGPPSVGQEVLVRAFLYGLDDLGLTLLQRGVPCPDDPGERWTEKVADPMNASMRRVKAAYAAASINSVDVPHEGRGEAGAGRHSAEAEQDVGLGL